MKRKKGQALVEFIIILPIIIIVLLGIIDFGLILYNKNVLEANLSESSEIYKKTQSREEVESYLRKNNKNIIYNWSEEEHYLTLELKEDYNFLTPGLNLIFPKDYKIEARRVMYNE